MFKGLFFVSFRLGFFSLSRSVHLPILCHTFLRSPTFLLCAVVPVFCRACSFSHFCDLCGLSYDFPFTVPGLPSLLPPPDTVSTPYKRACAPPSELTVVGGFFPLRLIRNVPRVVLLDPPLAFCSHTQKPFPRLAWGPHNPFPNSFVCAQAFFGTFDSPFCFISGSLSPPSPFAPEVSDP